MSTDASSPQALTNEADHTEALGRRVTARVYGASAAIDPTVWIGIIGAIIQMIQQCREARGTPATIKAAAQRRRLAHRVQLRNAIREQTGLRRFRDRREVDEIAAAILDEAAEADEAEIEAVTQEVL